MNMAKLQLNIREKEIFFFPHVLNLIVTNFSSSHRCVSYGCV